MMIHHQIPSLTDLTLDIVRVNKKFNIDACLQEMADLYREYGARIETLDQIKQLIKDPVMMYDVIQSLQLTGPQMRELGERVSKIRKSHRYQEWAQKCEYLRESFKCSREDYFHSLYEIYREDANGKKEKIHSDKYGMCDDIALGRWLTNMIEAVAPDTVHVLYEDSNGKVIQDDFVHHPVVITEDYVDASPIDKWTGVSLFDRFYTRPYWSKNHKKWVFVAPHLIIDVATDEMLEIDEDEDDENMGPFSDEDD